MKMSENKITALVVGGLVALSFGIASNTIANQPSEPKTVYITESFECTHLNMKMFEHSDRRTVKRPSQYAISYGSTDKTKAIVQFNFSSKENVFPARYVSENTWVADVKEDGKRSTITISLGEYGSASYVSENGFELRTVGTSCKKLD